MRKRLPSIMKATRPRTDGIAKPLKERPRVVSGVGAYGALDAFRQKRPPTPIDLVLAYRAFTFSCVNRVARAVANIPLKLYVTTGKGQKSPRVKTKAINRRTERHLEANSSITKKLGQADQIEEVTEHEFLELLDYVSPWLDRFTLLELTQAYLETVGCAFWTFVKGYAGLPIEIWPLPAWLVYVQPDYTGTDVISRYIMTAGGGQRVFEPAEVLYFRSTSLLDPYTQPWGPLRAAYTYCDFSDKLSAYDDSLVTNRPRPDAVLMPSEKEALGPISAEETIRLNSWFQQSFAMSQAGSLWVAPGGMDLKPYPGPPFDTGAEEKSKQARYNIARCFDIPPAMVDPTSQSRANLDATLLLFARECIAPRCRKLEEALNSNLLPLYDERLFCAFDNPVPADEAMTRENIKAYIGIGVMARNEARAELGLAPVDDGDELLVPNNVVPLSHAIEPPAPVIIQQVQGTKPDEIPDEAQEGQESDRSDETTPNTDEAANTEDKEGDEPFKEGDDVKASAGKKGIDADLISKARRIIEEVCGRLDAEQAELVLSNGRS